MSLRILFADDSVTAQNMGRKILTDAGYEVVAVSNGAAAVKKIAEQKPDIIILDLYMPGYTGLEVCEKVRGSVATLKTPVLLTVGKMEPYKPEEASRVRADGVIVKPFEASDLLAIVKKFEERIGQEPLVSETITAEGYENAAEGLPAEHPEIIVGTAPQATVDVPDHMATSSAFSDLLGTDSPHSMNNFSAPPPPVPRETLPPPTPIRTPIPEYAAPAWRERIEGEAEPFSAAVPATPATSDAAPPEAPARPPLQIPVYQEREEPAPAEILPTAAPPTGEMEIAREPELQENAADETRSTVADVREPGLIPTVHEGRVPPAAETAWHATTESVAPPVQPAKIPAPSFAEALAAAGGRAAQAPAVAETEKSAVSESDFEARVAAAMAAYSNAPENGPIQEPAVVAGETASESAQPGSEVEAVNISEAEPTPSFDYHPPSAYTAYTAPASAAEIVPESAADSPAAQAPSPGKESATAEVDHAVAASLEAAAPLAATAGAGAGADSHTIAQAVHRVMERLKPELVEEILRELKPKE